MTPPPTVQDLIIVVREEAYGNDPLAELACAARIAAALDDVKDELLGYFVDGCRGMGKSWSEISSALGVTKQAANRRFGGAASLERFTPRARRVMELAPTVARSFNHHYVGTEHLLLALLVEGQGVAARVLHMQGLTRNSVESAILLLVPRGDTATTGDLPLTPRVTTTMTGAVTAAVELDHDYVGTEHLLLALMRDPASLAARILDASHITAEETRRRIVDALDLTKSQAEGNDPPT